MHRRDVLAAATAVLTASLAMPHIARSQATRVLRFIPRADVGALDPHADPRPEMAAACLLVWDTLYGVDARLEPQPQMCAGHEASDDRRVWTFHLRPGLLFHDGEPVTTRDVIASLHRWMMRDRLGQAIAARLDALEAIDDHTFRFRLRLPFGPMLYALGKSTGPLAVVMPERIARADPFAPVPEAIGSGPMRPHTEGGEGLVFERFADYPVRPEGPDWLAGGKRILFERVEWTQVPDAAAAAEAIQSGDADWWEAPTPETVPLLKRNRNVLVDIADPLGCVGVLRLNHRQPPFDDVRARRAVMLALSQEACMAALTGGDDALWKPMPGVFTPGTPLAARIAARTAPSGEPPPPRDLDIARRLLSDAGAGPGGRAVVLANAAHAGARGQATAVATVLQSLGFAPEVRMLTASALGPRLAQPDAWTAYATWHDGAEAATPAWQALDAGGDGIGWPRAPSVQAAIENWYAAATPDAADEAALAVGRASLSNVTFIPTGFFMRYQAWRTSLTGIGRAPLPLFWTVQKT